MKVLTPHAIGAPLARTEGPDKITGRALYSAEYDVAGAVYGWLVQATVARATVREIGDEQALALPGVLAVIWHRNAPRLGEPADADLSVLQSAQVSYRGQIVAIVVAQSLETAREAAGLVRPVYDEQLHHAVLAAGDPDLYAPAQLNAGFPTDTDAGDLDAALAAATVVIDETYTTPAQHNNPMEPHASIARWDGDLLTVWDSNQAPSAVATSLATLFGLEPAEVHVITEHVGGGFGSKGSARPNVVAAAIAARVVGRPVRVVLTRQALFALVGYRTPTVQRVRLAADADGRLLGIGHDSISQTSQVVEFAEQTGESTRHMYAADSRRVTHRLARLDVPTPRWMRAPGECPGMYAVESAMDELALACGLDPVELRIRNEPEVDPATGKAFTSRQFVECLREGADRFGWAGRNPQPRSTREGRWLVGTGVAGSTYPVNIMPTTARVRAEADGTFTVSLAAADIGQGSRTVLGQIAADALEVDIDRVRVQLGDSTLPQASVAGGSGGTSSWGWAVTKAARALLEQMRDGVPAGGIEVTADISAELAARETLPRQAFGAQFVEVRVDGDTGEVRVPRALGVFAVGRIMNARTARSQLIGGMSMGLSLGLMEEGIMDPLFGDYANHDLAEYHVVTNADIGQLDVHWLPEDDSELNPMGGKGIGEIGIVGTAAAVTNAVAHATGVRIRDLPVRLEKLLPGLLTHLGRATSPITPIT